MSSDTEQTVLDPVVPAVTAARRARLNAGSDRALGHPDGPAAARVGPLPPDGPPRRDRRDHRPRDLRRLAAAVHPARPRLRPRRGAGPDRLRGRPALGHRLPDHHALEHRRRGPDPVTEARPGHRVVVFIPTYNEPVEVIAPTIAAACELQPAHQTWVLDDGDRPWVAEMCRALRRPVRPPRRARPRQGRQHEPRPGPDGRRRPRRRRAGRHHRRPGLRPRAAAHLPHRHARLVRRPRGRPGPGSAGLLQRRRLRRRRRDRRAGRVLPRPDAGPQQRRRRAVLVRVDVADPGPRPCARWAGSRPRPSSRTCTPRCDLLRAGWKTVLPPPDAGRRARPGTPEQYLLQRRRWGMGSMQVLVTERLWAAKRWLSWRNFYEYLSGTLWWLEGVGTVLGFLIPAAILVSGAQTSTAPPLVLRRRVRAHVRDPAVGGQAAVPRPPALADGLRAADPAGPGRAVVPVVAGHPAGPAVPGDAEGRRASERVRGRAPDGASGLCWSWSAWCCCTALLGLTGGAVARHAGGGRRLRGLAGAGRHRADPGAPADPGARVRDLAPQRLPRARAGRGQRQRVAGPAGRPLRRRSGGRLPQGRSPRAGLVELPCRDRGRSRWRRSGSGPATTAATTCRCASGPATGHLPGHVPVAVPHPARRGRGLPSPPRPSPPQPRTAPAAIGGRLTRSGWSL